MEWLNIHVSMLDSPEFLGSEPVDRATWLCLLRYCIGQENGGRILGAAEWGDRKWQQLVRVTLAEVQRQSSLWWLEDGALVVAGYPKARERQVKQGRKNAYAGAMARWRDDALPDAKGTDKGMGKGKGKGTDKGTGKPNAEGEGEGEGEEQGEGAAAAQQSEEDPMGVQDPVVAAARPSASNVAAYAAQRYSLADLTTMHPTLLVFHDQRERAEKSLALYGWQACTEAMEELAPEAMKRPPGKQRVTVQDLCEWLKANWEPDREGYIRAGLPIPDGLADG